MVRLLSGGVGNRQSAGMVLISEEINGLKLRVFKWNETIPLPSSQGIFFLRIYEHMIKHAQNGAVYNSFSMVPISIRFDLVYLSCPCYVKKLALILISHRKNFPPEEIESLAKSIAESIVTSFRFKKRTLGGEGSKPVIVAEIYRTKTVDFTQAGSNDDDYWQNICENELYNAPIAHECNKNINNPDFEDDETVLETEELGDESLKLANKNEIRDIVNMMKSYWNLSHKRSLRPVVNGELKGLYEVKSRLEKRICSACDSTMDDCPVCLQGFSHGDAVVTTSCSHSFHEKCIFLWLLNSISCPLCRSVCVKFV